MIFLITPPYFFDNTEKLLFKDDAGVCHKFIPQEVKCPADSSKIRKYPVSLKK